MGDRANVCIQNGDDQVYLYTHWDGSQLPEIVRVALASPQGMGRWNDAAYLARIVFCHLIRHDQWNGETGYGISSQLGDNEHPILVLDIPTQTVRYDEEAAHCTDHEAPAQPVTERWSFQKYIQQDRAQWSDES